MASSDSPDTNSDEIDAHPPCNTTLELLTQTVSHMSTIQNNLVAQQTVAPYQSFPPTGSIPNRILQMPSEIFHCPPFPQPSHYALSHTSGLPIGVNLPDRIKAKIWMDQYVEFYDIIFPDSEPTCTMSLSNPSASPAISILPKKKRALTQIEWSQAFDDFLNVYTQQHPTQLQALLSCGKFIKNLMTKGCNWAFYDSQFRKDREHTKRPWTTLCMNLHMEATSKVPITESNAYFSRPSYPSTSSGFRVPPSYCYARQYCQASLKSCKYKHTCPLCNDTHPFYRHSKRYNERRQWLPTQTMDSQIKGDNKQNNQRISSKITHPN